MTDETSVKYTLEPRHPSRFISYFRFILFYFIFLLLSEFGLIGPYLYHGISRALRLGWWMDSQGKEYTRP
jgi:hypothetical protein